MYRSGASLQRIADQFQISKSTVRKALIASGVRIRPHSGTPEGSKAVRTRQVACGNSPFGYAYLDERLVVHPKELAVVRQILQLRDSGLSFNAIARDLNAKSIPPRSSRRWDHSVISEIVRRNSDESLRRARGEV